MEPQNEKTRQKAGFSGVPEILKAFSGTLYGAGTRSRTRDLLITSQLLYQLSYTGVMGCEYIESVALVKPSCLIRLKKTEEWCGLWSECRKAMGRTVGDFSGCWAMGLEVGVESRAVGRCLGCLELGAEACPVFGLFERVF